MKNKHNKLLFLLSLISLIAINLQGQNPIQGYGGTENSEEAEEPWYIDATPDFYRYAMNISQPLSQDKLDTIWNVAQMYCVKDKDTCLILVEHAMTVTKNESNKIFRGSAYHLKGKAFNNFVNDSIGLSLLFEAKELFESSDAFFQLGHLESEIGQYYERKGDFKKAIEYHIGGIKTIQKMGDTLLIVNPLVSIGGLYFKMGKLNKAEDYLEKAIDIAEKTNNKHAGAAILTNQAQILIKLGDKYLAIADTSIVNAQLYRDSADIFYKKGLAGAEKSLKIANEIKVGQNIMHSTTTKGMLQVKLKKYKEAERTAHSAEELIAKAGIPIFLIRNKLVLAIAQRNLGNYNQALINAKAGYDIAVKSGSYELQNDLNTQLYQIYKASGRNKEALLKLEEISKVKAKENVVNTNKVIIDVETKYQTAQKEKQILKQKNDILELESTNTKIANQRNLIMGGGLLFSLLGFFGYRVNKIKKDRNDKREFAEALIYAQEEERKRIARDLHDGVGQSLLLIKKQMANTSEVTIQNQQMISDTLEEVRSISRDLHPFQLDKFGLTATIEDTILKIEQSTELFISKEIDHIDNALESKSEIHLFRTIQEILSNIVKHAEASATKIIIKNETDNIKVSIQDNGKGFDLELAVVASKSLGIRTMHERISAIGGQLKIERGENNGMRIEAIIPKQKTTS